MAIKGYLSEITFTELLKIISNYNGKLIVWNFKENKQYECFFYDQAVIYLNFCGNAVLSEESVKDVFLELLTDDKSYYAFQDEKFPEAARAPIVSVKNLMDLSLFETPEADDELLPHLYTRFETVNKGEFEIQGNLAEFWKDADRLLHKGCSGYDICIELGLEEKTVRQNLYKLRTSGLIKPVRMFNASNTLLKAGRTKQDLGRLAGKLGGARSVQTATTAANPPAQTAVSPMQNLASAANGAAWQNVYAHGGFSEKQPMPTILTENIAPPITANVAPTPGFPWQASAPTDVTPSEAAFEPVVEAPVEAAGEPLNSPDNQIIAEPPIVQASSAYSVQIPASQSASAFAASRPVSISNGASPAVQDETRIAAQNLISPLRTGLIKRMLNSLFRN